MVTTACATNGLSQGADALPFAINRLSPAEKASFEFHLGSWIGLADGNAAILPQARQLKAARALCPYG